MNKELDVYTFGDLLHLFPYKYIDKSKYYKINELKDPNTEVQIIGQITELRVAGRKPAQRLEAVFSDETGALDLVWFRVPKWLSGSLKMYEPYVIFGKCKVFKNTFQMAHPEMELLKDHQAKEKRPLVAVYPSTEQLSKRHLGSAAISRWVREVLSLTNGSVPESLSWTLLKSLNLLYKPEAFSEIHFPTSQERLSKAIFRLKFEELFFIQLQLLRKNIIQKQQIKGFVFDRIGSIFNEFYRQHLPFSLTEAQKRVLKEIRRDMKGGAQMNRLLQGDVGSGKTIVALLACLMSLDNGYQACVLAPTEILAMQHFESFRELLLPTSIRVKLLTGRAKPGEREQILGLLGQGGVDILVGTHAILEDRVGFQNLGLAVIDEQHRFGVAQRSKLWFKNHTPPHILVMTATPIPRTLAMSLYGDLDISVIDELPPNRKPVTTIHKYENQRPQIFNFIKAQIKEGRQAYIVYPLIEESESLGYKNLMEGYASVKEAFPNPAYQISMVHGQMKPAEKDAEMSRFVRGETQILVATTVIEVGVNVPNASVMVIESAERFGLSQLHQLRGRVGRGASRSYCILVSGYKISEDARTRLETLTKTNDGFEIAETDLKLRGPGDLTGTQQSGLLNLKIADIVKDQSILYLARTKATDILTIDPTLQNEENEPIKSELNRLEKHRDLWKHIS